MLAQQIPWMQLKPTSRFSLLCYLLGQVSTSEDICNKCNGKGFPPSNSRVWLIAVCIGFGGNYDSLWATIFSVIILYIKFEGLKFGKSIRMQSLHQNWRNLNWRNFGSMEEVVWNVFLQIRHTFCAMLILSRFPIPANMSVLHSTHFKNVNFWWLFSQAQQGKIQPLYWTNQPSFASHMVADGFSLDIICWIVWTNDPKFTVFYCNSLLMARK